MLKNNIDYIQTRSFLLANVNNIIENLNVRRRDKQNQSDDLFGVDSGNADPIQSTNWNFEYQRKSKLDILQEEKNSLGLYVSGNPLEGHADLLKLVRRELKTKSIHLVVVEKVKKIFTKHNSMMLALQITNHIERLEGIIFPTKADSFSPLLEEKKMYWIYGNIKQKNKLEDENEESNQYDQVPKLIVNGLAKAEQGPLVALSSAEADKADKTATF